jgi:hypothetical protein
LPINPKNVTVGFFRRFVQEKIVELAPVANVELVVSCIQRKTIRYIGTTVGTARRNPFFNVLDVFLAGRWPARRHAIDAGADRTRLEIPPKWRISPKGFHQVGTGRIAHDYDGQAQDAQGNKLVAGFSAPKRPVHPNFLAVDQAIQDDLNLSESRHSPSVKVSGERLPRNAMWSDNLIEIPRRSSGVIPQFGKARTAG